MMEPCPELSQEFEQKGRILHKVSFQMDLSKSTTEDDLLDMLGDNKSRATSGSDPFADVGLEQEQPPEPKQQVITETAAAASAVPPTPPTASNVSTGNSPAPEINDKVVTAQAKFLEVRRAAHRSGMLIAWSLPRSFVVTSSRPLSCIVAAPSFSLYILSYSLHFLFIFSSVVLLLPPS